MLGEVTLDRIIGPNQNHETHDLWVWRDHIAPDALAAADAHVSSQPERKMVYHRPDVPAALLAIMLYAAPGANTVLGKRYGLGEDSEAFHWHNDPEEYESILAPEDSAIDLITLGGYAILGVRREGERPLYVACRPNTHVRVYGNLKHAVTPSLSREAFEHFCRTGTLDMGLGVAEPRTFVFAGKDVRLDKAAIYLAMKLWAALGVLGGSNATPDSDSEDNPSPGTVL